MVFRDKKPKRINAVVPTYLYNTLKNEAKKNHITMSTVIVQYLAYLESRDRRQKRLLDDKHKLTFRVKPVINTEVHGADDPKHERSYVKVVSS